jgi:hypothetical protein
MSLATSTTARRLDVRTIPATRKPRLRPAVDPMLALEPSGFAARMADEFMVMARPCAARTGHWSTGFWKARSDAEKRADRDHTRRTHRTWDKATPEQIRACRLHVDRIMGADWRGDILEPGEYPHPDWTRLFVFAAHCVNGNSIRPEARTGPALIAASVEHARGFDGRDESRRAACRFYDYLDARGRGQVNRYLTCVVGLDRVRGLGYSGRDRFAGHVACCVHGYPLAWSHGKAER